MSDGHCDDCCCAAAWKALGITEYTGRSIPEEIERLRRVVDVAWQWDRWMGSGFRQHSTVDVALRNSLRGTLDAPCATCGGSGEVHISADDTHVAMDGDCPDCGGDRMVYQQEGVPESIGPCPACGGNGYVEYDDVVVEDGRPWGAKQRRPCPDCEVSDE